MWGQFLPKFKIASIILYHISHARDITRLNSDNIQKFMFNFSVQVEQYVLKGKNRSYNAFSDVNRPNLTYSKWPPLICLFNEYCPFLATPILSKFGRIPSYLHFQIFHGQLYTKPFVTMGKRGLNYGKIAKIQHGRRKDPFE